MAVAWLNASIASEMAFATGWTSTGLGYWDVALEHWMHVVAADPFWKYVGQRAETCGVSNAWVEDVRERLPWFLAGLIGRFAQAYGRRGESVSCHRLVGVLQRSTLPERVQQDAARAIVQGSFY